MCFLFSAISFDDDDCGREKPCLKNKKENPSLSLETDSTTDFEWKFCYKIEMNKKME